MYKLIATTDGISTHSMMAWSIHFLLPNANVRWSKRARRFFHRRR